MVVNTKNVVTNNFVKILIALFFSILLSFSIAAAKNTDSKIVTAAIKEGSLNWLDSIVVPSSAKVLANEFKKYYNLPESFNINHERIRSGALCTRVAEEIKAGKVLADIFGVPGGAFFEDLIKAKALLKYDSPESKFFKHSQEIGLSNFPGYWQSAVASAFAPITYPNSCRKNITSWYDLLDPQFKNQKISFPVISAGGGPLLAYIGWRQVLPKSFFEELVKQKPTFDRGSSLDATQRLLQKESLVAITSAFRVMQASQKSGVEMKAHFPKEGVMVAGIAYAILAEAPHPNAAKLFYDFLLSEKGNKLYIDLEGTIAIRDGSVVSDKVKKYSPPLEEINAISFDLSKLDNKMEKKYKDEFKEIFKR